MLAARYHDTIVLLHVTDGLSPRTLAGRFGASLEEVRAVLIEAGALDVTASRWRNSLETSHERRDRRTAPAPSFFDENERALADQRHVNAITRALRGYGFPVLRFGARPA